MAFRTQSSWCHLLIFSSCCFLYLLCSHSDILEFFLCPSVSSITQIFCMMVFLLLISSEFHEYEHPTVNPSCYLLFSCFFGVVLWMFNACGLSVQWVIHLLTVGTVFLLSLIFCRYLYLLFVFILLLGIYWAPIRCHPLQM